MFTTPHGPVTVTWQLSSPNGPNIGSLRTPAIANGAAPHDTLVLIFRPQQARLTYNHISVDLTGIKRLRQLLGRAVRTPDVALAESLNCARAEIAAVLRGRGDHDLADFVERP